MWPGPTIGGHHGTPPRSARRRHPITP
jgi:hypothetical protein